MKLAPCAFDFETFLMSSKTGPAPPPVCISYATGDLEGVLSTTDESYEGFINQLCNPDADFIRIAHNLAFDLCVIAMNYPHLRKNIYDTLEKGNFACTVLREKLLNLTTLGWIDKGESNGRYIARRYDLATLVKERFDVDIAEDKKSPDAWRLRYSELAGMPADSYPQKAYDYALMDSVWTLRLYNDQEERRNHIIASQQFDPFDFEGRCMEKLGMQHDQFKAMISFDAQMVTCQGLRVNKAAHAEVNAQLDIDLAPDKLDLLFGNNILRPAIPELPWANGALAHIETCDVMLIKNKKKRPVCGCPPKMKAAEKEKLNKKVLQEFIVEGYLSGEIPSLVFSPKCQKGKDQSKEGAEFVLLFNKYKDDPIKVAELLRGNTQFISAAKEFFAELEGMELDPVLIQFQHRNNLQKIKTSSLPAMCHADGVTPADFVWPGFDVLKVTGRFSSYGVKLYPSMNVQQVDARMRKLIIPRENHWFYSIDYASLEFISAASRFIALGIDSVYARLINEGGDCHGYLAASLAYNMDPEGITRKLCDDEGIDPQDYYGIYKCFMKLKKNKNLVAAGKLTKTGDPYNYFKYWRTFAKPIGLGIVGGMGYKTLAKTAKIMYSFIMTDEEAKEAKAIDLKVLPEVAKYLDHIKKDNVDYANSKKRNKKELVEMTDDAGNPYIEEVEKTYYDCRYVYTTPLGLRRPACNFTQCANGEALQSPSTEGVQVAIHLICKETFTNPESVLYGNTHFLTGIIHDEIVGDVVADAPVAHAVITELMELLDLGLEYVCEGVKSASDPALMMVWSKAAYDKKNEDGHYVPYDLEE